MLGGLVATGASAGCTITRLAPASATDTTAASSYSSDSLAVRRELERYYADFSARDWSKFADHFWPGAVITTVWQPPGEPRARVDVQTVPGFVAKAPEGPGSKPIFDERMTDVTLRIHGGLAQAWARYQARFGDSTSVNEWRGVDAITLLEHDGRWRIVSLTFTDWDGAVTDRR